MKKVLDKGSEIQYNTVCSPARPDDIELVLIRARVHPFPFRTRKLSSLLPKILVWRRTGKIGNADTENGLHMKSVFCSLEEEWESVHYSGVRRGVFVERPNRFVAHVELDGQPVVCHVKNTGRCQER